MLTEVSLSIYYYQLNRNDKKLIVVEMEYGGFERMTEEQIAGKDTVYYDLIFNF